MESVSETGYGKIGESAKKSHKMIQGYKDLSYKERFIRCGLTTPQQLVKLNLTDLSAKFPNYTFSSSVRDLGIILDQELTFAPHLNRLSRDCFYQLRQLRTVARSLSTGAAATLVHSFITIRLDYCLS